MLSWKNVNLGKGGGMGRYAFTFVELFVVLAVVCLLLIILLPSVQVVLARLAAFLLFGNTEMLIVFIVVSSFSFAILAHQRSYSWRHYFWGGVVGLLTLCFGCWSISQYETEEKEHITAHLLHTAHLLRNGVAAIGHEKIPFDNAAENDIYQKVVHFLCAEHTTESKIPPIHIIYTMRKDETGRLVMFVTSGICGQDGTYRYPIAHGETMSKFQTIADKIFDTGQFYVSSVPYANAYDEYLTVMGPLYGENGKIEAVLGVDYRAMDWVQRIHNAGRFPLQQALFFFIVGSGVCIFAAEYRNRKWKEEKLLEQESEKSQARMMVMLDTMPMACHLLGPDMHPLDTNLAAVKLLGFQNKQHALDRYKDAWPEFQPDGRQTVEVARECFRKAMASGYCLIKGELIGANGKLFPAEISFVRAMSQHSAVIVSYVRDIRQEKMLIEMREAEERMSLMLDAVPLGCALWEPGVQCIDCNMAILRMFGIKDLPQFRTMFAALSPEFQANGKHSMEYAEELITESIQTGIRMRIEWMHRTVEGVPLPVELTIDRVTFGDKNVVAVFTRDLREVKAREAERQVHALELEQAKNDAERSRDVAETANQAKSVFLNNMSHELRTPLNGIIGLSDVLLGKTLNNDTREFIEHISSSGKSLLEMVNAILDYSKMETESLSVRSKPFGMAVLVQSVLDVFSSRAAEKNLELGCSLAEELPPFVRGDAERIRQILINVVDNAIKFTKQGGVRIEVTVKALLDTELLIRFCVVDTGIGISPNHHDKLFNVFSKVDDSMTRSYGGTGVGLAIAMKLVRLLGGEIGVESEEGKGSTFWFELLLGKVTEKLS